MSGKDEILYVVMPAYNEEDNIETVIKDWYPVICENTGNLARIVIVNDGSTDHTAQIVMKMIESYPQLILLDKANGGHGSAVLAGYQYALKKGADFVFQTDSDGQTDPQEFKEFWDGRNEYDAMIATRPERKDGRDRILVERVLCCILRVIFGVKISDSNAPFRLMRASILRKYINILPADFFLPNVMLTTYFVYYHENVKFLPVSFRPRQGGTNTINWKKIFMIGLRSLKEFTGLRKEM
ncbi:MAG TPA: glycosyl transferase family 2 [Oribacterium sp.]|nr:glycosyl transferase family 2 [Oribacterium sp.]